MGNGCCGFESAGRCKKPATCVGRAVLAVSIIGIIFALGVIPCNLLAFCTTNNFWVSISFLALKYLAAEAWFSPMLSMMQRCYPKEK